MKKAATAIIFFCWIAFGASYSAAIDQINPILEVENLQHAIDVILSPPANECSNRELLRDQSLRSSKLGMTITSRCSSSFYLDFEPDLLNKMNAFIESTVIEGIERVAKYNPALSCEIKRRLPLKPFLIACEGSTNGGYAVAKPNIFYWLGIGKFSRKIVDGGLANHLSLLAMLKKNPDVVQMTESQLAEGEITQKNTIFHEVLHDIGIKNQSVLKHNHPGKSRPVDQDVVYSCANMVFTSKVNGGFTASDGKFKYMSHEMCLTCASFQVKGECAKTSAAIDPSVICNDVKDILSPNINK